MRPLNPASPPALCGGNVGSGPGGVQRTCRRLAGHAGRCHDMPFLDDLRATHPAVASKIERDSFRTRGASWGQNAQGEQTRRNRQPRWTLEDGHVFYPGHHQTYPNCLAIASELTLQAYEMTGAPACPAAIAALLPRAPVPNSCRCTISGLPLEFAEFALAEQSKAAIDTDHLHPSLERHHVRGNVVFVHHICNTTKGNRSLEEFVEWMKGALQRHGYGVTDLP